MEYLGPLPPQKSNGSPLPPVQHGRACDKEFALVIQFVLLTIDPLQA
jgi:hypothetical protein